MGYMHRYSISFAIFEPIQYEQNQIKSYGIASQMNRNHRWYCAHANTCNQCMRKNREEKHILRMNNQNRWLQLNGVVRWRCMPTICVWWTVNHKIFDCFLLYLVRLMCECNRPKTQLSHLWWNIVRKTTLELQQSEKCVIFNRHRRKTFVIHMTVAVDEKSTSIPLHVEKRIQS